MAYNCWKTAAGRERVLDVAIPEPAWFVAVILVLALVTVVAWWPIDPARAFTAVLAVLVVTCPCALSLATPVALAAATTRLARLGVLVTRADAIERLARADTVIFDKTGTLTGHSTGVVGVKLLSSISREQSLAMHGGKQIVSLGREMQLRAVSLAEGAHQVGVVRREEPDGSAAFLVFLEKLCGHRLAVSFLVSGKPQHRGAVALERLPESAFDVGWSVHVRSRRDCVAKLRLRRIADRDSVGFRRAFAGAMHVGTAGERSRPVLLCV